MLGVAAGEDHAVETLQRCQAGAGGKGHAVQQVLAHAGDACTLFGQHFAECCRPTEHAQKTAFAR